MAAPAETVQAAAKTATTVKDLTIPLFGFDVNVMALALCFLIFGLFYLFWRIQRTEKLDFADMITKDGRAVSLTKVLQLVGGLTATWIMIKLTLSGGLTEGILGIYLAYIGGVEGYSKFLSAKYSYSETSVKDAQAPLQVNMGVDDPSLRPPREII